MLFSVETGWLRARLCSRWCSTSLWSLPNGYVWFPEMLPKDHVKKAKMIRTGKVITTITVHTEKSQICHQRRRSVGWRSVGWRSVGQRSSRNGCTAALPVLLMCLPKYDQSGCQWVGQDYAQSRPELGGGVGLKRVNPLHDPATIWVSWPGYQAASCGSDRSLMQQKLCWQSSRSHVTVSSAHSPLWAATR